MQISYFRRTNKLTAVMYRYSDLQKLKKRLD